MTHFSQQQKVLFKHCDPAGIVFYPRYFEMMNDCVEAFFDQALGMPFEKLHTNGGLPTAAINTRFAAPSRHGDWLDLRLAFTRIGTTSATYKMTAICKGQLRFETVATLVSVGKDGRPKRWADDLRQKLEAYKESDA
ncbi:MAG: thioesterase family protein [Sulfitobacter sp.]